MASPSECPKALSLEWPASSRAGAAHYVPAGAKCYWPREGTLVHQDIMHSSSHPCAKLKQCVVLACFILLKKVSLPPCPYVLNVYINSYLNSKLEILFTLISLFSQMSA